ncbi:MAG: DNA alkylation repair protein [Iphinoe sp. HA4291-MV1]|jgi:3-methyladenine DNA glycosylase AlkC|nr:DNA alkylation repair protein [Iphinoe sp. HA4291-MV1]
MITRKGSLKPNDVPIDVLNQLNSGVIETVNLSECLAVDFATLMEHVVPELTSVAKSRIQLSDGITKRMAAAGKLLLEHLGSEHFQYLASHPSDSVRGWAAYMIASIPDLSLAQRLNLIRPLANDNHFGVREWSWLALRPYIADQIHDAVQLLIAWVGEKSPNLRRFAIEGTRPRGVWCSHIPELKENPEIGLPLLEPARADVSRYVRDSVSNWLNDAAKSRPEWVQIVCARWQLESDAPETIKLCARALRSLKTK